MSKLIFIAIFTKQRYFLLKLQNGVSYLRNFLRLLESKRFGNEVGFESAIVGSNLKQQTPEAIDWREKGFKTQSDNQRTCGSCYAFSIAESIEGQVFKRTGRVLNLR